MDRNGSKVSVDEGFEAPEEENISNMQPLFSNDMTGFWQHLKQCTVVYKINNFYQMMLWLNISSAAVM